MPENPKVRFVCLDARVSAPRYASPGSAGADLCALLDAPESIAPGQTKLIPTGLKMEIPTGLAGMIFARSGLASKRGLAPANKVGVVDSDYRGEIMVALHNHGLEPQTVEPGERIAQLVLMPVVQAEFVPAESLEDTQRGEGGFGSTGRH